MDRGGGRRITSSLSGSCMENGVSLDLFEKLVNIVTMGRRLTRFDVEKLVDELSKCEKFGEFLEVLVKLNGVHKLDEPREVTLVDLHGGKLIEMNFKVSRISIRADEVDSSVIITLSSGSSKEKQTFRMRYSTSRKLSNNVLRREAIRFILNLPLIIELVHELLMKELEKEEKIKKIIEKGLMTLKTYNELFKT